MSDDKSTDNPEDKILPGLAGAPEPPNQVYLDLISAVAATISTQGYRYPDALKYIASMDESGSPQYLEHGLEIQFKGKPIQIGYSDINKMFIDIIHSFATNIHNKKVAEAAQQGKVFGIGLEVIWGCINANHTLDAIREILQSHFQFEA